MAYTAEELQGILQTQTKDVILGVVGKLKGYTDNAITVAKDELKAQITEELSGVEGLAENLEKLQALADAFVSVFDSDNDGNITADEIIAKISAIQANIDKVAADLENYKGEVSGLFDAVNTAINDIKDRVGALEIAVSQNRDEIANVKADLSTNYYTKDEIATILTINKDEILEEVDNILNPQDEEGDGATL